MRHGRSWEFAPLVLAAATPAFGETAPDIVVRGEKAERTLKATPSSVAVVRSEDIDDYGLRSLPDIVARTANVSPSYGASGFVIRGIANNGVSGAGEAATANVFIDGIPLAPTFLHAAPTDLWDVAQVEIWRGPQSTLRGQNALAGAVIIETADPALDRWDGHTRSLLGDDGTRGVALAGGGPFVPGTLAGRVAVEFAGRHGAIRNLTRHTREDSESRSVVRAKLAWVPQVWPAFSLELGYMHFRRRGGFFTVYARTDAPGFPERRIATDDTPNTTDVDLDGIHALARYEAGTDLALISETTWSGVSEVSRFDGDFGPASLAYSDQQRRYRSFSQELRLALEGERLSGVAGLYYFDRRLRSQTQSRTIVPTPIGTIASVLQSGGLGPAQANAVALAYGAALPFATVDFTGSFPTKVRTFAFFADLRYRLTDRLSLLAGMRLERYEGANGTIQQARFAGTFPNPAAFGALAPVISQINSAVGALLAQANADVAAKESRVTAVLPKAGLLFDWNDRLSTALVVQRGYRPGGVSINIARGQAVTYDPEYLWNGEFSLRALLANGRLRLGANAYYAKWRDQQVSVNFGLNSFDFATLNAASSHIYGFELDAAFQPTANWSFYAALGHSRTRFDRFAVAPPGIAADLRGTRFAFAPPWTLSAGAEFRSHAGLAGALSVSHASGSFAAVGPNQKAYAVEAHSLVDARLGYDGPHWSAYVAAKNLLDETYVIYKSPAESRAVLSEPRRVMIEFQSRF